MFSYIKKEKTKISGYARDLDINHFQVTENNFLFFANFAMDFLEYYKQTTLEMTLKDQNLTT